jgi:hypothetical protein
MFGRKLDSIINSTLRLESEYSENYVPQIACTEVYSLEELAELEEMFDVQ